LPNETANVIKQHYSLFLLVVKSTALKQQISQFYPQAQSLAFTFMTGHVIASVCAFQYRHLLLLLNAHFTVPRRFEKLKST